MPAVFQNVELAAFRGRRDLRLDKCAGVNLLVGPNNSGKTSVLEALAILSRPTDLPWWIKVAWQREIRGDRTPVQEMVKQLFPHYPSGQPAGDEPLFAAGMRISAQHWDKGLWKLEATWLENLLAIKDLRYFQTNRGDDPRHSPPPPEDGSLTTLAAELTVGIQEGYDTHYALTYEFNEYRALPYPTPDADFQVPCAYVTTVTHRTDRLADRLGAILLKDQRKMLTDLLAGFQPGLQTFEVIAREGQGPVVYLRDRAAGWLPISAAGDGLRRAFYFAAAVLEARGGVLLIDEIELALHTSALRRVFGFLIRQCRELDVQLFATTHSLEAFDAVLEESRAVHDDIAAFVLGREAGTVRRVDGPRLHTLREEHGFDIR